MIKKKIVAMVLCFGMLFSMSVMAWAAELDGWQYDAICHVLCITGARSDKEYFRVADSYIRWVSPDASMFYNKSSYDIYYAIFDEYGYIF